MIFTEVIKLKEGKYCNLGAHLARMYRTTKCFFGCAMDLSLLSKKSIPSHFLSGIIKCRIVYSDRILSVDYTPYTFQNIKKIALVEDDEIEYNYKFQDRSALNCLKEARGDADEILIVKKGLITDTSFTNVVFRDERGAFFTPNTYLLAGTKRQMLLDNGIIRERRIRVEEISQYAAIYLINAMIDIEDELMVEII